MNRILKILYSPRTTLGLLVIFGLAMAAATFIENSYDTVTSQILVYDAVWFEILMILMIINFYGSIKRYQLLTWKKAAGFIFHTSFIIIIIGAGVTRYIGYEGSMPIREGASSNFIFSDNTYLTVKANDGAKEYNTEKELKMGMITDNSFSETLEIDGKGAVEITYKNYIRNVKEVYEEGMSGGFVMLNLKISEDGHQHDMQIRDGEIQMIHNVPLSFNNNSRPDAILITGTADDLKISYPTGVRFATMPDMAEGFIAKDSLGAFKTGMIFNPESTPVQLVLTKVYKNAVVRYEEDKTAQNAPAVLIVDIAYNGKNKELAVFGGKGYADNFYETKIDDLNLMLSFGAKKITLPFELYLNDFQLDRYAGSMSPSSYASEVTLIDKRYGKKENHRIFMNNVLDYDGYRFFQSSYDQDELGTVLSVNHDFWGTLITYIGYGLMIFGFIWTLFNKHSRYWDLMAKIREIRKRRKELTLVALLMFYSTLTFSQHDHQHQHQNQPVPQINPYSVSAEHADKFGELIVLTYAGRLGPVHTLAVDVMHKVSRKDNFDIPGRGKMTAVQVFLDMPINPEFWKQQKIIYIREKSVSDLIGATDKYVSFSDFFDSNQQYKLMAVAENAFRKPEAERNTLDKEIIKVNERLEIFMMAFQGSLLDIFPVQNSKNNKWISWDDQEATHELTGNVNIINEELQLNQFNYQNIQRAYFIELINATKTADYTKADKLLTAIKRIQRLVADESLMPSESKIEGEISYNKSNIFINLKNLYGLLSILLLILAFVDNLRSKKNTILTWSLNACIAILAVGFIYHTYGMGMRWYLSGHAPWSNGYEALILISWSSLLAGFSFMRYSKITLAATSLLAFFTLMTASHSSYDPQLTNLQPVLKSYWLIIHVATLTISYGFFGLAFFLGLFNMGIYLVKTPENEKKLSLITRELTYINEMNLTIGLFLATIGTFLGGVWANESWGRYWGWDAKETWALIITVVYTIILHLRLAPKIKGEFIFNVSAILGFGSVIMTFVGVNYYFTKGMHSYANGDTPVFPAWAWITILTIVAIIVVAWIRERRFAAKEFN